MNLNIMNDQIELKHHLKINIVISAVCKCGFKWLVYYGRVVHYNPLQEDLVQSEFSSTQEFVNYVNRLNLNKEQIKNLSKTDLIDQILSEFIGRKVMTFEIEKTKAYKSLYL